MAGTHCCPGLPGRGPARHNGGCCTSFAALAPADRARRGVPVARPAAPVQRPTPPDVEVTSVPELIQIVTALQAQAAIANYPENPASTLVHVEIGPDDDFDQAMALIELGQPYGLLAAWRRLPAPATKGS